MRRRTVLLGLIAAAVPVHARAATSPRWQSMSKRRFAPSPAYRRPGDTLRLPVRPDLPRFPRMALKLTGGPLLLDFVEYRYTGLASERHALGASVERGGIVALPAPSHRLIGVDVVSRPYADGHRYWHLIGSFD